MISAHPIPSPSSSRQPRPRSWGRTAITLLCASLCAAALVASPAFAKKSKKGAKKPKVQSELAVIVLPFTGFTADQESELRSAVELELELAEGAALKDGAAVAAAAGSPPRPGALARAMKSGKIDVAIHVDKTNGGVVYVGYGEDGKPRFAKVLGAKAKKETIAAATSELRGKFGSWSKLKPVAMPTPEPIGGNDVLVDDDAADKKPADDKTRPSLDAGRDSGLGSGAENPTDAPVVDAPASTGFKATHFAAVSLGFAGSTWRYQLEPLVGVAKPLQAAFFPGATLRADLWLFEFLGLELDATASLIPFRIKPATGLVVTPEAFNSPHINVGATLRGRYLLKLGEGGLVPAIGFGARLGGRGWLAMVEPQTITVADGQQQLTVVPGFRFASLSAGLEVYVPMDLFDHRLELELKGDVLPLTFYAEDPDNPGARSRAIGGFGEALARFDLAAGVFAELSVRSTGLIAWFEEKGDRQAVQDGIIVPLGGGTVYNWQAGFTAGVGYFF